MGASDLTTDVPGAEVVDDGRPVPANGANGHVGKVAKRKPSGGAEKTAAAGGTGDSEATGAVMTDARTLEQPAVEEGDELEEVASVRELDEVAEVDELAGVDELQEGDDLDIGHADELDADQALARPPADGSERARRHARKQKTSREPKPRRRAARRAAQAESEPKLRRRAARRAAAARRATPAGRRAELVATAASIAAAGGEAATSSRPAGRVGKLARRLVALVAILMFPAAVYALATTDGPVSALPQGDAAYLSEQVVTADQRVRKQLARLRPLHTSAAIARTRDSQLTARSIALELGKHGGEAAARLQRALNLEASWLDAVGSVLSNPRSPLRDQLVARDAALRPALAALPSAEGLRRTGGAEHLRDFAKARIAAKRRLSR
jgi:hypothetical protein